MISTILLSYAYGHYLGASAFGELYFAITFVSLIGTVTDGFGLQVIRDVAPKPENAARYCSNILLIKFVLWFIFYILMLLVSWLLGYSLEVRILIAICGFDLLSNVTVSTFVSIQYALGSTAPSVIGGLLEKWLVTLLGILLLRLGAGVWVMAALFVIGSLVNLVWQATWYLQLIRSRFVIDFKLIRQLVKADLPFLLTSLLMTGYNSIDTVLLSLMKTSTVIGFYGAASRVSSAAVFLPNIIMMVVMYPIIAKLATASDAEMKLALEKSINFLLFCVMPISTIFVVAAPNIIEFLYGGGFTAAVPALQALAPCLIIVSINFAFSTVVLSKRRDKALPISSVIALAFNIGLNLILIPLFQAAGPAIVTSLTELLVLGINAFIIPRSVFPLGSLSATFKALIASLLMAVVIFQLHTLSIFVMLPIGMLVYLVAAFVLRVLPWEDYKAVYNAVLSKGQQKTSDTTEEKSEVFALTYDSPTMPLPAFFGGIAFSGTENTLLDIQMAITNQLPVIRLPQASKRTGLLSRHQFDSTSSRLPDTPLPSYALKLEHSYDDEPFDVSQFETGIIPAMHPYVEQPVPLQSVPLLPTQPHSSMKQEPVASSLQEYTGNYGGFIE